MLFNTQSILSGSDEKIYSFQIYFQINLLKIFKLPFKRGGCKRLNWKSEMAALTRQPDIQRHLFLQFKMFFFDDENKLNTFWRRSKKKRKKIKIRSRQFNSIAVIESSSTVPWSFPSKFWNKIVLFYFEFYKITTK